MDNLEITEQSDTKLIQFIRKLPLLVIPKLRGRKKFTKDMTKALRTLVENFCDHGYLRTHSFLSSWVKEYTTNGLLGVKELCEIVDSCPWSRDQTKKYLDLLEKNNLIHFTRNSDKKKICGLNLLNNSQCSSELKRMLSYYSKIYRAEDFNSNNLTKALQVFQNCTEKSIVFETSKIGFDQKSKRISHATVDDFSVLIERLISAYSEIHEEDSQDVTIRLTKVLTRDPLLFRGLKREKGE